MEDRKRSPVVIDLMGSSDDESDSDVKISPENPVNRKPPVKKAKKNPVKPASQSNASGQQLQGLSLHSNKLLTASGDKRASQKGAKLFNLASYNIWFGPPHPEERMIALAEGLFQKNSSENPLLFIGFQEVTPTLWLTLRPLLVSAGYRVFCQEISICGYGCAMAVLQTGGMKIIEHGFQLYQTTIMNRGFLYVRAQFPQSTKQILFTTTHLESYVGNIGNGRPYTGSPERALQVQQMESFCNNHLKRFPDLSMAVISGDLNWDDERIQSKGQDATLTSVLKSTAWSDSWFSVRERRRQEIATKNGGKVKKKDEPTCYTYDSKESAMLGGNLRRRFDRILFRQQNSLGSEVEDVELIGRDAIPGLTWNKESTWNGRTTRKQVPVLPSDHFGYVVTFSAAQL